MTTFEEHKHFADGWSRLRDWKVKLSRLALVLLCEQSEKDDVVERCVRALVWMRSIQFHKRSHNAHQFVVERDTTQPSADYISLSSNCPFSIIASCQLGFTVFIAPLALCWPQPIATPISRFIFGSRPMLFQLFNQITRCNRFIIGQSSRLETFSLFYFLRLLIYDRQPVWYSIMDFFLHIEPSDTHRQVE